MSAVSLAPGDRCTDPPAARGGTPPGVRLYALRVAAGVSQFDVATDAALEVDRLDVIEDGTEAPTLAELVRLCTVVAHYAEIDAEALLLECVVAAGILPAETIQGGEHDAESPVRERGLTFGDRRTRRVSRDGDRGVRR